MARLIIKDKLGGVLESYEIEGSLLSWIKQNVKTYEDTVRPPYSATLNGKPWPFAFHDDPIYDDDLIELSVDPQTVPTWVYWAITAISTAYSYYQIKNIPDYQKPRSDGQSIYSADARANRAKPSGVVREMAGSIRVFPDLICYPRRKYIDHEEYLYLMMAVTRGYAFVKESNVYIAETPITNYAGDYTLNIYEPGDTVTGNEAHENWYETREVSGLELVTSTGPLFGNWKAGYTTNTITAYYDDALTEFPFPVGSKFRLNTGTIQGIYRVASIGSPNHTATVVLQDSTGNNDAVTRNAANRGLTPTATASAHGRNRGGTATASAHGRGRGRQSRYVPTTQDSGTTSLTPVSPVESVEWEALNGGVNWEGPFQLIPEGETARYCEVDVNFPGGLVELDGNGKEQSTTVEIIIQYREAGSASWTTAVDTSRSPNSTIFTDSTFDERGYTVEIDFGSEIRPEMRFRRVTKDSDDVSITDNVYISRVKCKLETKTSYPDITTIALSLKGTNAVAATSENLINLRGATRKLPTLTEIENAANGTPYDISAATTQTVGDYLLTDTATRVGVYQVSDEQFSLSVSKQMSTHMSEDGRYLLTYDGVLKSYRLNTPYSFASGFVETSSVSALSSKTGNAMWLDSGTKYAYLLRAKDPGDQSSVACVSLSEAYNLNTATGSTSYSFPWPAGISVGRTFYISNNGAKLWIFDSGNDAIYQYSMSTAYDPSTLTQDTVGSPATAVSLDLNSFSPNLSPRSFWMEDGALPSKLWMNDASNVYYFEMSTAGDISTATLTSTIPVNSGAPGEFSVQVSQNYLYFSSDDNTDAFIHVYLLDKVSDSRSSRSIMRFIGNALYDAIGSDAADSVDWAQLQALDTTLEARGDYLDADFSDETTLWEALKVALVPAFSEPAMREGKFYPVRTVAGNDYTRIYTPDFMLGDGLLIEDEHYDGQEPDGVDVEYYSNDTGEMEVVKCRLSGDRGIKPRKISLVGVTDETRAWRIGMRERRRIKQKPSNYSFTTEMDALNSEYGDPIAVSSEIFGGQYATVTAAIGANITLDIAPDYAAGQYYAAFKKPNGRFSGLYPISTGSPNNVIVITSSPGLDFTPVTDASPASDGENTLVAIGLSSEWGKRAIVKSVSPKGDNEVDVIAEEYVSDIYADDNNTPS